MVASGLRSTFTMSASGLRSTCALPLTASEREYGDACASPKHFFDLGLCGMFAFLPFAAVVAFSVYHGSLVSGHALGFLSFFRPQYQA